MKILQIISSLSLDGGGPVEGLIQQVQALTRRGHTVEIASLDADEVVVDKRLHHFPISKLGPSKLGYRYASKLRPWLLENYSRFDVVIVNGLWQYHGYCVASVARQTGFKYVVFTHGMLDPWFARQYKLKHLKKWLYWPWGEYRVLRGASLVLFTTIEELKLARQSFWLYSARERVVGYGIEDRTVSIVEQSHNPFLKQFPQLLGKRCFLFLSRIHPKKGVDMLIGAFARVANADPEMHLIIAGPDSVGWRSELQRLAAELGVEGRVTFTGMLVDEMKWGAFDASEVFVLPSHQENFGVVVAEALASSLPVLITNKVNIWREVENARAGYVEHDSVEGVVRLLNRWISSTDIQRNMLRSNARECFRANFEMGVVTGAFEMALDEAAKLRPGPFSYCGSFRQSEDEELTP